jgi:misacylated tRNA(Ala) deacylase
VTTELFRNDAYLKENDATVVSITDGAIELNQTVFYAEGGGQPGDRGVLRFDGSADLAIVDTRHGTNGSILHVPADGAELPPPGAAVQATIDWEHRYRHMRTHTCLHLLCSLIPFPVTGGSISQAKGRLDFDMVETIDKLEIEAALRQLIAADHPVAFRWISDQEMSENMALVRTMSVAPPMGAGQVRLVDVEGVDLQPCGGTHVVRTGEIGEVRIGKVEKKGKHNRRVNLHLD